MKTKIRLYKLSLQLTACLFLFLAGAAYAGCYTAYEYYPSDPYACNFDCCGCGGYYEYDYHYMRFSSPHRHNPQLGQFETQEYEWVGDP